MENRNDEKATQFLKDNFGQLLKKRFKVFGDDYYSPIEASLQLFLLYHDGFFERLEKYWPEINGLKRILSPENVWSFIFDDEIANPSKAYDLFVKYYQPLLKDASTETIKKVLSLIDFFEYDEDALQFLQTLLKSEKDISFLISFKEAFTKEFYMSGRSDLKIILKEIFPHFLSWRTLIQHTSETRNTISKLLFQIHENLDRVTALSKERRELILKPMIGSLSLLNNTNYYSLATLLDDGEAKIREKNENIANALKLFEFISKSLPDNSNPLFIFSHILYTHLPYNELSKTVLLETIELIAAGYVLWFDFDLLFHLAKEMIDKGLSKEERDNLFNAHINSHSTSRIAK
jgi:hypothetical protein